MKTEQTFTKIILILYFLSCHSKKSTVIQSFLISNLVEAISVLYNLYLFAGLLSRARWNKNTLCSQNAR